MEIVMTIAGNVERVKAPDLFAPELRRERVVEWQAPGPVARAAMGMSGLEAMRAIRDSLLPEPPMARLIDFRLRIAEPGRIVMELEPHESLENTVGLLHGANAAALLDTAMGCAISTMLPAGRGAGALGVKFNNFWPPTVNTASIKEESRPIKVRRHTTLNH